MSKRRVPSLDRDVAKLNARRLNASAVSYEAGVVSDSIYGGNVSDPPLGGASVPSSIHGGIVQATIYGGAARTAPNATTIYGGSTPTKPLEPRGAGSLHMGKVVKATVVNPKTRQPLSVTYDRQSQTYLDTKLKRWVHAPNWMIGQIR